MLDPPAIAAWKERAAWKESAAGKERADAAGKEKAEIAEIPEIAQKAEIAQKGGIAQKAQIAQNGEKAQKAEIAEIAEVPAATLVPLPPLFNTLLQTGTLPDMYVRASKRSVLDEPLLLHALMQRGATYNQARRYATLAARLVVDRALTSRAELDAALDALPLSQTISKSARQVLSEFDVFTTTLKKRTEASDGSSTKLLLELSSGHQMEAVILRYGEATLRNFPGPRKPHFKSNRRTTVCVSSQVGCAQGCTFCATGTMGLILNLTPGEILEQVHHANVIERQRLGTDDGVRNVVFMGMGEPLDNYESVVAAIRAMVDPARFGISAKRISLSTVLPHPRLLDRILKDVPMVSLAFSLHAPTQAIRNQIVPSAKGWKLDKGLEQLWEFCRGQEEYWKTWKRVAQSQRTRQAATVESEKPRILIEYILIKDLNCTPAVAKQLGQVLGGKPVILNLIPYNPVAVISQLYGYEPPLQSEVDEFVRVVRETPGLVVHVRQELGQDVGAACGQLVVEHADSVHRLKRNKVLEKKQAVKDVEDLFSKSVALDKFEKVRLEKRDAGMEFLLALAVLIGIWIFKQFIKYII